MEDNAAAGVAAIAVALIAGWALFLVALNGNTDYEQHQNELDHMAEVCSNHGGVKSFDMTGDFACKDGSRFSVGNIEVDQ